MRLLIDDYGWKSITLFYFFVEFYFFKFLVESIAFMLLYYLKQIFYLLLGLDEHLVKLFIYF